VDLCRSEWLLGCTTSRPANCRREDAEGIAAHSLSLCCHGRSSCMSIDVRSSCLHNGCIVRHRTSRASHDAMSHVPRHAGMSLLSCILECHTGDARLVLYVLRDPHSLQVYRKSTNADPRHPTEDCWSHKKSDGGGVRTGSIQTLRKSRGLTCPGDRFPSQTLRVSNQDQRWKLPGTCAVYHHLVR